MSTTINISCIDQVLQITSAPVIASGDVNEDTVSFTFCSKWDGFTKTAVFYRNKDLVYNVLLSDNSCTIPQEVLNESGTVFIGVFGVNGNHVRTSNVVSYVVEQGAITTVADPTLNIYEQIIADIGAAKIASAEVNESDHLIITTEDNTEFDAGYVKGDRGVSGVYVGSGNMPEGYNVQIDPSAESTLAQIITIAVADWDNTTTCIKFVPGVTNDCLVICDSSDSNVLCTSQGNGNLTFTANSTPTAEVTVKVVVL